MQRIQLEAARIVNAVMGDGRNLTQVLSETLRKRSAFSPQQRGAVQDLSYGTIRYHSRLAFILGKLLARPLQDSLLHSLILVALYQLLHTKAGQYAIVDHAVRAAKTINPATGGLVNAVLRNFLRQRTSLEEAALQSDESRYSYSQWWIDAVRAQYGAQTAAILEAGNTHPPMTLRVNRHYSNSQEYQVALSDSAFGSQLLFPDALKLDKPTGVEHLPRFAEGWVSVQDAGAQYAARLLDVHDGMRVLDACAAPGGKSAHLLETAAIELLALDKDEQRLDRVKENLNRLGLSANVVCGDAANPAAWWDGRLFNRILADVPCSASGVVRRHPDIKWLRRPADIEQFAAQQKQILEALWPLLERNGKLLYATCSIFARENQQVIAEFLLHHADAHQIALTEPDMENGQLLPNDMHDGFYYALLHKQASSH